MRRDWIGYVAMVLCTAALGVAGYFGLWLCGMSARPIGYAGAALVAVAVLHFAFIVGRSIKEA